MSDKGLSTEDVSFSYRATEGVLNSVSVRIPRRGLIGILGPNGSGKTTLLRLLNGLLRPSAGRVTLDGAGLHTISRATVARRIAMVPQDTQLAFEYTVLEMAMMGRYPHLRAFEIEGPNDLAIARDALRTTGTLHLESRLFNTLSGGEKQRVVIASALAQNPDILLLDEPTASLDLAYQLEVRSILSKLNSERQITIVVSTHDLNFAASLCHDLILLDRGRVLAAGSTQSMLERTLIQKLYGVDVDITSNARTGRLTIVPVARATESLHP
jgi:iron complex transport system ATP-binding protein